MKAYGIIPARYDSSRFPGKPLALILGQPMYWHVYRRAQEAACLDSVCLATDDDRILTSARQLEVPVLMTARHHPSGTDRILEAARLLKLPDESIIVNIQGDEPALDPLMIRQVLTPFKSDPQTEVATLARKVAAHEAQSPDVVKVVLDAGGKARYFSRSMIPHYRDRSPGAYLAHIGLYAYRMRTLARFAQLRPSCLEKTEKLEQLRLIENGIEIAVVTTDARSVGVDRESDISKVENILRTR